MKDNEEKIDNEGRTTNPAALGALIDGDLKNFAVAATPGGIEAQEAQGQKDLIESDMLPKKCPREKLERLGFEFGEDIDDLFVSCKFPKGWKKVATDHSMGSNLVDNKDRVRGMIFYKAAFYDKKADMRLTRRFRFTFEPEDAFKSDINYQERTKLSRFARVYDEDKIVFESEPYAHESLKNDWDLQKEAQQLANNWLQEHYPEWEDVLAYWD